MTIVNEKAIRKKIESLALDEQKRILGRFDKECKQTGLSKSRRSNQVHDMRMLGDHLKKPYADATKEDIIDFLGTRDSLADATKNLLKVNLKKFYKWLQAENKNRKGATQIDDWVFAWLKPIRRKTRLPADSLITKEEIERMIKAVDHPRDKALISVLFDSALRPSELASLRMKSVQFDTYGASIILPNAENLKTGQRRIRVIDATPYLQRWWNEHDNDDPEAPLWPSIANQNRGEPMSYYGIRDVIKRTVKKAGIKKNITAKLFRHTQLTERSKYLSDAELKVFAGWEADSDMAKVYVHLSGGDVDHKVLSHYGLLEEEETEKDKKMISRNCPRCKNINASTDKFCSNCSMALDRKTAMELERKALSIDQNLDDVLSDPEVRELILRKLMEKQ